MDGEAVYVVHAKKLGESDSHNYIVGVFKTKRMAIEHAKREEEFRGEPKYLCEVSEFQLGIACPYGGKTVRGVMRERFPDHFPNG